VQELLDICCNLIVLDETAKIIRFAHLSVREFFGSLPEFGSAKVNSGISSACLELVDGWNSLGISVWSWNLDPMGRYINGYLRYHLRETGSRERLTLLQQLLSFLKMATFATLDDRSRKFWRIIRNPPNHVDPAVTWVFNACAFGFGEIVELVINGTVTMASNKPFGTQLRSSYTLPQDGMAPFTFNNTSIILDPSQIKETLTPATYTCLALHAIKCQSYSILHSLLEKNMCLASVENSSLSLNLACGCSSS
jgi:hypothetical protein